MPTVLRLRHLRVVIYPNDHRPAHVHVQGAGSYAVFLLNRSGSLPTLREVHGFGRQEVGRIRSSLMEHLPHLWAEWSKIHGDF